MARKRKTKTPEEAQEEQSLQQLYFDSGLALVHLDKVLKACIKVQPSCARRVRTFIHYLEIMRDEIK